MPWQLFIDIFKLKHYQTRDSLRQAMHGMQACIGRYTTQDSLREQGVSATYISETNCTASHEHNTQLLDGSSAYLYVYNSTNERIGQNHSDTKATMKCACKEDRTAS